MSHLRIWFHSGSLGWVVGYCATVHTTLAWVFFGMASAALLIYAIVAWVDDQS